MTKLYQLVAWTEKGQARMVPSLVAESVQTLTEALETLERQGPCDDEISWLLRRSRAHEALGSVYEGNGQWLAAFSELVLAATVCTDGYESCWLDCDEGYLLVRPLRGRFFAMYARCRTLLQEHPQLQAAPGNGRLQEALSRVTRMERIWSDEFNAGLEASRAWNFGKHGYGRYRKPVSEAEARKWRVPAYFLTTGW